MLEAIQLKTSLYEIAMSIGNSTEAETIADESLPVFVEQLYAHGALLCQKVPFKNHFHHYQSYPQHISENKEHTDFIEKLCQNENSKEDLFENGAYYYHLFTLEGFGLLIVICHMQPLGNTITKALQPVCKKLSNALSTSIQAKKNQENLINFKTLIDTMREGLALFDEELHCIEINQAALNKFGYSYEEGIGMHIFSVIAQSDRPKLLTLTKQEEAKSEWTLYKKDGSTFPAFVSGSNITYKGKSTRIVTFIDLTEIKEKEKQLYAQSRLAQMGEMISMIAHQWRQPLGAISASVIGIKTKMQMQKFDLSTPEGREAQEEYLMYKLDKMGTYVEHLSETIEDFRNFFKPNKEKTTLNLEKVLNKALNIVHPGLLDQHIKVVKEIDFHHTIETYSNEVLQALLNILKNAIDHFESAKIASPYINIKGYEDENRFIIQICDNGGGIPKNIIDKIFDPYFSTKDEKNGTGLGLYMTKTMIEDHCKGKLEVKNYKDGVCFKITLS